MSIKLGVAILMAGMVASAAASAQDLPSKDFALRKQLTIVGSTSMRPYLEATSADFVANTKLPEPVLDLKSTGEGIDRFCSGVGVDFPDIAAASRRITRSEFKRCRENQIGDIIEIVIGHSAVAIVVPKGHPVMDLTQREFFAALADEVPANGDFVQNPTRTWKDVHPRLPANEIKILLPSRESGTRQTFNDRMLEAGCRHVPEIRTISIASYRVARCTTPRDDGAVIEIPDRITLSEVMAGARPGTIAVVPREAWLAEQARFDVMPVAGLLPTVESIQNDEYELSRHLYLYFKTAHMRDSRGFGITRGLREYMLATTSDGLGEPGGTFEKLGLVLLRAEERAADRLETILMRPLER
ncbi:MAG: substrate-binding domain-containing protein [Alphaproteobacteria bacterium]|nr:substrate-binding domain-containing protein [Alphaproteobacteria bacterium]